MHGLFSAGLMIVDLVTGSLPASVAFHFQSATFADGIDGMAFRVTPNGVKLNAMNLLD